MKKFFNKIRHKKGFTTVELIMATLILLIIVRYSYAVYINYFTSWRYLKGTNLVYEEARFTTERIVKEIRNNTIDYEEYFNKNAGQSVTSHKEGLNYCKYSQMFYNPGEDGNYGTFDDKSLGERLIEYPPGEFGAVVVPPAIGERVDKSDGNGIQDYALPIQEALYLININGKQRTYIKKITRDDGEGNMIGRIGLLRLIGKDYGVDHLPAGSCSTPVARDEGEGDNYIDTWLCDSNFDCEEQNKIIDGSPCKRSTIALDDDNFIDITPSSLDIIDLKFIISPMDDPRKAYDTPGVQIQPHVTLKVTTQASPKVMKTLQTNTPPSIVINSTISSRIYHEIITECNRQECSMDENGDGVADDPVTSFCPNQDGVCSGAEQTCQNGVLPGCTENVYATFSNSTYGKDNTTPFDTIIGGHTYYEHGSEAASCIGDLTVDTVTIDEVDCIDRRCSDGKDNDCNGLIDASDPSCILYLCNNNTKEADEICADVGGSACQFFHPLEADESTCASGVCTKGTELSCNDNLDNDCDGNIDKDDTDCINKICSNGVLDHPSNPFSENPDFNEVRIDIGGPCGDITADESGTLCLDGLDNDDDGNADEFDGGSGGEECQEYICNNGKLDCDLVTTIYTPTDYLGGYSDPLCSDDTINNINITTINEGGDEKCVDIGGICGNVPGHEFTTQENNVTLCFDGLDNNCDGNMDGDQELNNDPGCCSDADGDSYFPFTTTCHPLVGLSPIGKIDCDDDTTDDPGGGCPVNSASCDKTTEACAICKRPASTAGVPTEICDATDNVTIAIDSNCSGKNYNVGARDDEDPECCIDEDGDGYGIIDASRGDTYIYSNNINVDPDTGKVRCGFSASTGNVDCNDSDPDKYPGNGC